MRFLCLGAAKVTLGAHKSRLNHGGVVQNHALAEKEKIITKRVPSDLLGGAFWSISEALWQPKWRKKQFRENVSFVFCFVRLRQGGRGHAGSYKEITGGPLDKLYSTLRSLKRSTILRLCSVLFCVKLKTRSSC